MYNHINLLFYLQLCKMHGLVENPFRKKFDMVPAQVPEQNIVIDRMEEKQAFGC